MFTMMVGEKAKNPALRSGKFVNIFEKEIAKCTSSKYAVACVNGTSALQISLEIIGVKKGDEVIAPSLTFIAPINAINYRL